MMESDLGGEKGADQWGSQEVRKSRELAKDLQVAEVLVREHKYKSGAEHLHN